MVNNERYSLLPVGHSVHNLNQNSVMKDNLRMAWHGVESLLQKAEGLTAGTSFRTPIAIVNVLIELGNVSPSLTLHATFINNCPRPLSTTRTQWKNWLLELQNASLW